MEISKSIAQQLFTANQITEKKRARRFLRELKTALSNPVAKALALKLGKKEAFCLAILSAES